jgi:hypothetical protein
MSSGGQNGSTLAGSQGMRIRDASDFVTQNRLKLMFTTNNPENSKYTGVNAYRSKGLQNSYNFLLQVQQGLREFNGGNNVPGSSNVGMGNGIAWTSPNIPASNAANQFLQIATIPPQYPTPALSAVTINISNTIPIKP